MVVEHEFICTLPPDEFLRRSTNLLVTLGFSREAARARACTACGYSLEGIAKTTCPECGTDNLTTQFVEFSRGKKPGSFSYELIPTHPQRVLAHLDRGKVTVAASIEQYRGGGDSELHRDLMTALCTSLERTLNSDAEPHDAPQRFREVEDQVMHRCKRQRMFKWIVAGSVVGLIIFSCFGLAMCAK
ncbi:MAG TPA: hypothetical protein VK157_17690 [Phycisphaerales bacterium]|nr:hypothetical protein [Phycisphaerales bacterium]